MSISALPAELLLQIFSSAVSYVPSTRSAPLNISHTCRNWRILTINEKSLWALKEDRSAPSMYINGRLVRLWLDRGDEQSKLDIHLTSSLHFIHEHDKSHALMSNVLACGVRWKILRIFQYSRYNLPYLDLTGLPDLMELYMPFVGPLRFEGGARYPYSSGSPRPPTWVPPYRESINGPIAPDLRILQCSVITTNNLFNTLRHCPNISELRLTAASDAATELVEYFEIEHDEEDETLCVLNVLEKLVVSEPFVHRMSSRIRMPSLTNLQINATDCETLRKTMRDIPHFIRISHASPRSVTLLHEAGNIVSIPSEEMHTLLESLPEVERAVLGFRASKELTKLLSSAPSGPQLLPKLLELTLLCDNDASELSNSLPTLHIICADEVESIFRCPASY